MRIAVLADIHGNLHAFEAALEHVQAQRIDKIIIAGDIVVGAPDSVACWERARGLGCPILRGNHERYIADLGTARADPLWATPQYAPVQWAAGQLSADERAALGALPLHLRLPDAPDVVFVHASLRSDADGLRATTPEKELPVLFPGAVEGLIVRGHNHIAATRPWGERMIITAGSVGLPLDCNPTAQYLLLERRRSGWSVAHQAVPYDLDAALRRFETSGYLEATGVIGHLYRRELATASFQIVPFLRAYRRWSALGPLTLQEGLARFYAL